MRKFTRNNRGRFTKKKLSGSRLRNNRGRYTTKAKLMAKKGTQPRNDRGRWLPFF